MKIETTKIDRKTGKQIDYVADVQSEKDATHTIYTLTFEGYQTPWQAVRWGPLVTTFNIWKLNHEATGPTGPWQFAQAVLARDEKHALEIARSRFGLDGQYSIYEGF